MYFTKKTRFSDPCILECRRGSYATPRGRVKDGTRCNSNPMSKDVCIEGVCQVKFKNWELTHEAH